MGDFLELLAKEGISLHYGEEELRENLEIARRLARKQGNNVAKEELLIVSNSSIIIALARICHLDLMKKLFKKVIVRKLV